MGHAEGAAVEGGEGNGHTLGKTQDGRSFQKHVQRHFSEDNGFQQ